MIQSGGAKNTFFLATLYHFQKSGRAITLPAPPSMQSLIEDSLLLTTEFFIITERANDAHT